MQQKECWCWKRKGLWWETISKEPVSLSGILGPCFHDYVTKHSQWQKFATWQPIHGHKPQQRRSTESNCTSPPEWHFKVPFLPSGWLLLTASYSLSLATNFTKPRGKFLIPPSKRSCLINPSVIQFTCKLKPWLSFFTLLSQPLLLVWSHSTHPHLTNLTDLHW